MGQVEASASRGLEIIGTNREDVFRDMRCRNGIRGGYGRQNADQNQRKQSKGQELKWMGHSHIFIFPNISLSSGGAGTTLFVSGSNPFRDDSLHTDSL